MDKIDQSGSRVDKIDQSGSRVDKTNQSDLGTRNFDELGEVKLEQGIEVVECESTVSF